MAGGQLNLGQYARALRLPFVTASILPFVFGSLIDKNYFKFLPFLLGLVTAAAVHLGDNLLNDYADSKSGADWQDKKFYGFFGGSKLIQEGRLSEKFYLKLAVVFFALAVMCVIALALLIKSVSIFGFFFVILFLGFFYSHKPLQFSYHRWGEPVIFVLFGPALVMGGYFIQTKIFPSPESFMLSLPFGFLTTAILFCNEVPDAPQDREAGKLTWVGLTGAERAFILYGVLAFLGFVSAAAGVARGYLRPFALLAFVFVFLSLKAANILRKFPHDKERLVEASKLTIAAQALVSLVLIAAIIF